MEPLIFVAIFLLAGLGDLLVRWLRGKTRAPESDEELVVFEEAPEEAARREWFESQLEETTPEPVLVEPALVEPAPVRAAALEEIVARRPERKPVPPPPRRRARARRWITDAASARQGIVMMTILGRCRGLDV